MQGIPNWAEPGADRAGVAQRRPPAHQAGRGTLWL